MKKSFLLTILFLFLIGANTQSYASQMSTKRANLTVTQMRTMSATLDTFDSKIHTKSLFSPEENEELFNIKSKLDNQMINKPDTSLAPLYFKAGNIFSAREYNKEAADCYQTITENFGSTIYAQKAKRELARPGR